MVTLPEEAQLRSLYACLRGKYFTEAGRCLLPPACDVRIEWSKRLTSSAGICYPGKRLIRLSTHYHQRFPEEIESTLLHEMIHLLVPGHGPEFYAWLERIRRQGGRVARYAKERATQGKARWLYHCRGCGARWLRYRRLRGGGVGYVHKGCGGSLVEKRLE